MFRSVVLGTAAAVAVAAVGTAVWFRSRARDRLRPFVLAKDAKVLSEQKEVRAALDAAIPADCAVTMLSGHPELTADHLRAAGVDEKFKKIAKDNKHHLVVSSAPGGDKEFQLMAIAAGVPKQRLHVMFKTNAPADEPQFAVSGAHVIPHSLKFGPSDAVKREVARGAQPIIVVTWDNPAGWASGGTSGNDLAFWFLTNDKRFAGNLEAATTHAKKLTTKLHEVYIKKQDDRKTAEEVLFKFFRTGHHAADLASMASYMSDMMTAALTSETPVDEDEVARAWFVKNDRRFKDRRTAALEHAMHLNAALAEFARTCETTACTKESTGFPDVFGSRLWEFVKTAACDVYPDCEQFVMLVAHVTRRSVPFKDPLARDPMRSVDTELLDLAWDLHHNKMTVDQAFHRARRIVLTG